MRNLTHNELMVLEAIDQVYSQFLNLEGFEIEEELDFSFHLRGLKGIIYSMGVKDSPPNEEKEVKYNYGGRYLYEIGPRNLDHTSRTAYSLEEVMKHKPPRKEDVYIFKMDTQLPLDDPNSAVMIRQWNGSYWQSLDDPKEYE